MFCQTRKATPWNFEHLASYHLAQAEHYNRLKMATVGNPFLYDQYEEQQFYNKEFTDRYKALTARPMVSSRKVAFHNQLVNSLQKGGDILYARHAQANVGIDQPNLNFQDCWTQRNLSDKGRRQAIIYGQLLRSLRIPIQFPVQASPYCRTRETAALTFGAENVQVSPFLAEFQDLWANLSAVEQKRILSSLTTTLETKPPSATNKMIIAHSLPEGVGLGKIPSMGTVVVKPLGQGEGYEVIARVSLRDLWEASESGRGGACHHPNFLVSRNVSQSC